MCSGFSTIMTEDSYHANHIISEELVDAAV